MDIFNWMEWYGPCLITILAPILILPATNSGQWLQGVPFGGHKIRRAILAGFCEAR